VQEQLKELGSTKAFSQLIVMVMVQKIEARWVVIANIN
jgi:hypothetical protein